MFSIVLVVALAVVAIGSTQNSSNPGWNELINTDMFDSEINSIQTRSSDKDVLMGQLEELLGQRNMLPTLYQRYLKSHARENPPGAYVSLATRHSLLKDSILATASHNIDARNGLHSWEKGINQFSVQTQAEFRAGLLDTEMMNSTKPASSSDFVPMVANPGAAPANFDWRSTGKVTKIKNQDGNSCTTFATTAQLEIMWSYFKKQNVWELSPQQVLDCAYPGSDICSSGMFPEAAYELFKSKGAASWESYPYSAPCYCNAQRCNNRYQTYGVTLKSHGPPGDGSENAIASAVYNNGPVYVCINISRQLKDYRGGVFDGGCQKEEGQHSVLVMGYGTENGKDYYLIKNSWGENWGESGYLKLRRNYYNLCDVTNHPRIISV